jgi:sortase A
VTLTAAPPGSLAPPELAEPSGPDQVQSPGDVPPPRRNRRRRRPPAAPRPPAGPLPLWRVIVAVAALTLSALAIWSVLYVLVIGDLQHARSQHELYAKLRAQLASATAPIGGVIKPGAPVAVLTIPSAGLHGEVVVEGTTSGELRAGPGHLRTTPLPGQPGSSVVYGRALSFGAPFARIGRLESGSAITVTTDQGVFHFAVADVRHAGDPWVLPAAGGSTLTLVTSEGGWTANRIVYVDAVLKGKPAADPGGRLNALSPQEKLMAGETDPLTVVQVVLWLQLLVVAAAAVTWLASRWTKWQVWLVALPALLAVLWGLSNAAVRLMPNLM